MESVGLSLRYWKELGDIYPPARVELELVRDTSKTNALRGGSSDRELFADVSAINEMVGQVQKTSSLFRSIAERDEEFASRCFPLASARASSHARLPSGAKVHQSPRETVERLAGRLNRSVDGVAQMYAGLSSILQKAEIENYVEDVQQLLEILRGVGEADKAQRLQSMVIESLESDDLRAKVREQFA